MPPKRKSAGGAAEPAEAAAESVKKVKVQQSLGSFFKPKDAKPKPDAEPEAKTQPAESAPAESKPAGDAKPKAKAKAKPGAAREDTATSSGPAPSPSAPGAASTDASGVPDWPSVLGAGWHAALGGELSKPYLVECLQKVRAARQVKKVYPPEELVFNAFRTTPLEQVKVVIVGQDPYHQPGQAMGLCFSVMRGVTPPPSLKNMYKEIGMTCEHGDLSHWARQGVFMLNALLTVEESTPMAHKALGWDRFTDAVIQTINDKCEGVVFLLWGKPAQKKGAKVDRKKHHVLEAGHPSPLSVRFFLGCGHFVKTNEILTKAGKQPIDWQLPK